MRKPAPIAAGAQQHLLGGAAAKHVPNPKKHSAAKYPAAHVTPQSLAENAHAGHLNGGGVGTSAGASEGGRSVTGGTGNGTPSGGPCGQVHLLPGPLSFRPDGTVEQHVIAKVIYGDGRVELAPFPYPFTYPGEKLNPFQHGTETEAGGTIPIQQPPDGSDASTFSKTVQFVLKYTNPKTGTTLLPEC